MLEDMATLTGGVVISEEVGRKLESVTVADLGRARRVESSKEETTIVEGRGKDEDIQGRIGQIKAQIEDTTSEFDKEKLQERLAKLSGGVAIIKVGAATEIELKEKKGRVEDALSATRAAVEEGIVPGGGAALVRAALTIDKLDLSGDEATGSRIVRRAVDEPVRLIATNSGAEGSVVLDAVMKGTGDFGYDAENGVFGSMMERGIMDPAKVTRAALENAVSVAGMILTTESLVSEIPRKESAMPAAPPMDY